MNRLNCRKWGRYFDIYHSKTLIKSVIRPYSHSLLNNKPKFVIPSSNILRTMSSQNDAWIGLPIKKNIKYPDTRRDESIVDNLHGHEVRDPYRYLEDPDSKETQTFVEQQSQLFNEYIENPTKFDEGSTKSDKGTLRDRYLDALTEIWNYEKVGCPTKHDDSYYYFKNTGLQPQSVLLKIPNGSVDLSKGEPFIDPNKFSEDGTVALSSVRFSKSGKIAAYSISTSGSDWQEIHVRLATAKVDEPDNEAPLDDVKFSGISWTHDDKGFFYNKYPKPSGKKEGDDKGTATDSNINCTVYYHHIGQPQSSDPVIFKDPENPKYFFYVEVSDDGKYLILTARAGTDSNNKVYITSLDSAVCKETGNILPYDKWRNSWDKLVDNFEAEYEYITNEGTIFYFQSTLDSPRRRIVKIDVLDKQCRTFKEFVPQSKTDVLQSSRVVDNNKLILTYLHDVKNIVKIFEIPTGKELESLNIPLGSVVGNITGKKESSEIFYSFYNFTTPGTIYRHDFKENKNSKFYETNVPGLDSSILQTEQIFYKSKDGTKVPMYIVRRKDTPLNGDNVTLLYGYGGFDISILPSFSLSWITFIVKTGAVVAIANIRGGGEYGKEWHDGGRLKNKQNVFDDFQYAAKYLISNKYTSPKRLAINGGSNGGLLVGACLNQAPELFACGVAQVGVMDMVRFHKFTIGHAWISDYGDPDVKEDFEVLYKYSPLHNIVKDGKYPAVLVMTADHDDRVVPSHSLKYLANLQYLAGKSSIPRPLLGRIETKAGHGAGRSTQQTIKETADKLAFIGLATGSTKWY